MRLPFRQIGLAAALLLAAGVSLAAQVPGLYQASAPAADQSAESRERALRNAFGQVLVRLTGDRYAASNPANQPLLAQASQLAQGYGFESTPGGGLQLKAVFDAKGIERQLRALGQPFWGSSRPSHLIWVVAQGDGRARSIVGQADVATRGAGLTAAAEARGLALGYPSMDSVDARAISVNDVWNESFGAVLEASRRYSPDRIVVARAERERGTWRTRWALLSASGEPEQWVAQGATLDEALAEGLHQLADREATQFAFRAGGYLREMIVEVSGVRSLADYARALNYMRGLSPVKSAAVDKVAQQTLSLRLRIEGDPDGLQRIIRSGSVLRENPDAGGHSDLTYVLQR